MCVCVCAAAVGFVGSHAPRIPRGDASGTEQRSTNIFFYLFFPSKQKFFLSLILVIARTESKGNKSLNDVFIVNLGLCSDVQVKNEAHTVPENPPSLNIHRVSFYSEISSLSS